MHLLYTYCTRFFSLILHLPRVNCGTSNVLDPEGLSYAGIVYVVWISPLHELALDMRP